MSSSVLMVVLAAALVSVATSESVKVRVEGAFNLLHQGCRDKVKTTCAPQVATVEMTSHRRELCENFIRRNPLAYCMQTNNCTNDEINAFRNKVCDFGKVNELNAKIRQLSTECRPVFQRCMVNDPSESKYYYSEDFCRALSESSKAYDCVHDNRMCGRDYDRDLYEEMSEEACRASAGTMMASLLLVFVCSVAGKITS